MSPVVRGGTVAGAVFLAVLSAIVGPAWEMGIYRLLVDGGLAVLWVLSAAGAGHWVLILYLSRRERVGGRLLHFTTAAALGLGVLGLVVLGLGLLGWMSQPVAIALLAAGLAAGVPAVLRIRSPSRIEARPLGWLWLLLVPFLALTVAGAMVVPGLLWGDEPHGYDVAAYHLQVPREWFEAGRVLPLRHNVYSFFPFGVEMHYLWAMHLRGGPWAGMYLAQLIHAAFVALAVASIYAAAIRVAPSPAGAIIATLAAAAVPWLTLLGAVAYNEGGLLLYGTLCIAWSLRWLAGGGQSPLLIAGAMAGFACGTKLTAAPMLLLAVPAALLAARAGSPRGGWGVGIALFLLAGLASFSPWLIRNSAWAGNPVFPQAARWLGKAHFTESQVDRWNLAHRPRHDQQALAARLHAFWRQVPADWRYGYLLLPLGLIGLLIGRGRHEARFLGVLLLLLSLIWLLLTHLQGRFFILAIPTAALLAAHIPWKGRWLPAGIAGVAIAATASLSLLYLKLLPYSTALGIEDLTPQLRQSLPPQATGTEGVLLVGDARAFWYQCPRPLLYRTVFDLDISGGDLLAAWLSPPGGLPPSVRWALIDPLELRRLSSTYWGLRPPPPHVLQHEGVYAVPMVKASH